MRNAVARAVLALLAVIVLAAAGCQPAAKAPMADTRAMTTALDSLNKAFNAAVAASDTETIVGMYALDARVLAANAPRADGHDAIRAVWAMLFHTPGVALTITSTTPIMDEGGDMIVDIGTYTMKMNDPKGKPMQDVGKYVTIYKKVDGQWKIAVDTWNSDAAAPTPVK